MSSDSPPPAAPAAAAGPVSSRTSRPSLLVPAAIGGLVLLAVLGFVLFGHPGGLFAKPVKEFATRDIEVRSSTDPSASSVLGHLQRGDVVSGSWVSPAGGHAKWLKVKWPGQGDGYIAGKNLSDHARPELAKTGGGDQVLASGTVVYAEPNTKAAVLDSLAQGETASTLGATSDGWTEVALNPGGVGYVQSAVFQSVPSPGAAAPPAAASLGGVTHYVCAFAADQSVNPPPGTSDLSFYLDEGRACINHRYAYFADDAGGLKRVMLNDKARRASLLYFLPGRKAFYRTDFSLSADDYAKLQNSSAALESITCPPPGDAVAASAIKADLVKSTPDLDPKTTAGAWRRRVWQCSPAG